MEIKHEHIKDALVIWSNADSRRSVTLQITRAYFSLGLTVPILQPIELADHSIDYLALHNNKQNILQRWLHGDTPAARQKIQQLLPAILKAMPVSVRAMLTSRGSVVYLATQALKKNHMAITAALLNAQLADFIRECDEAERAFESFRTGVQKLLH